MLRLIRPLCTSHVTENPKRSFFKSNAAADWPQKNIEVDKRSKTEVKVIIRNVS